MATKNEAIDFKDSTNVSDAVEVFIVEELDPVDLWGGGATLASGTATAKVVSTDNQLPLNQNHMAHELGHVLGLGHPGQQHRHAGRRLRRLSDGAQRVLCGQPRVAVRGELPTMRRTHFCAWCRGRTASAWTAPTISCSEQERMDAPDAYGSPEAADQDHVLAAGERGAEESPSSE